MAILYKSNIDLGGLQLINASIHPTDTEPSGGTEGQVYFNTTSGNKKLYVYDGSTWVDVTGDVRSISGGTGIGVTDGSGGDATVSLSHLGLETLAAISGESAIDSIFFYDVSSSSSAYLTCDTASGIAIDGTSLKLASIPNTSLANSTFQVSGGNGLTGGGSATSLGSSDSLAVGAGLGITVNTDDVAIKNAANFTDDYILMWDDSNGQLTNSPILLDNSSNIVIGQSNDVHNLIISGNLTVEGTTTTIDSNTVNIGDNIIVLNADETNAASADAGIEIERGTDANVTLKWNESSDYWQVGGSLGIDTIPEEADFTLADDIAIIASGDSTNRIRRKSAEDVASAMGVGNFSVLLNAATRASVSLTGSTYTVTHNLGTKYVMVEVVDSSTFETVMVETARPTTNTVTIAFASAPGNGNYVCMVTKVGNIDLTEPVS
jgi:hypothetical protein